MFGRSLQILGDRHCRRDQPFAENDIGCLAQATAKGKEHPVELNGLGYMNSPASITGYLINLSAASKAKPGGLRPHKPLPADLRADSFERVPSKSLAMRKRLAQALRGFMGLAMDSLHFRCLTGCSVGGMDDSQSTKSCGNNYG
jgi:hypothetical protein